MRPAADDHIVLTGQSLAIGPTDIKTATAPYPDNVFRAKASGQLIPMFAQTYESPALALAASVYAGRGSGTVSMAVSALDGAQYAAIKKGTATYASAIAVCSNLVDTVNAVHVVHGEGDTRFAVAPATYQGYLNEWQTDYDTDIKTTTGQVSDVALIVSQVCSWPAYVVLSGVDHASIGLAQLDAHRDNAAITLACPAYQLAGNADGIHLTGAGSHHLGELMARAHLAVVDGAGWNPLMPLSVVRTGAVIVVEFDVPVAPLVIDTTTVSAQTHYGFTYHDDTATAAVSSVALGGNGTSVEITLTTTPTGTNPHVGYGYTSTKFGNLRDSETAVSTLDATPLANWCVHFYEPVTT